MELKRQTASEPAASTRNHAMPGFLKLAYAAIAAVCGACFFIFLRAAGQAGGKIASQVADAAARTSAVLMFSATALVVIYGLIAVAGAVRDRE